MDKFKTSVKSCARCGHDHNEVEFQALRAPITADSGDAEWTHWAPCPVTGEPILLKFWNWYECEG